MLASRRARAAAAVASLSLGASLSLLASCSFDTDTPAPHLASPSSLDSCGSTETVFPKLMSFLRDGRFAPLKRVIERRLIAGPDNPRPDPSLRTLLDALVRVLRTLGLYEAATTASLLADAETLKDLEPLVLSGLRFLSGETGGEPRYEATEATADLIRTCDPDHLLTALEKLLRLKSTSQPDRLWLSLVSESIVPLLEDPMLKPFLDGFEKDAAKGKPAVIALIAQVLGFLADDGFAIQRVENLLEANVYPSVQPDLQMKLERLVDLLGEATSVEAGILVPLQRAVRCLQARPVGRDQIVGVLYDFTMSPEVGLVPLLKSVEGVVSDKESTGLRLRFADLIGAVRDEVTTRDDLLSLAATLLSKPDVEAVVPVLTELIDEGVLAELLEAAAKLLEGCGRE